MPCPGIGVITRPILMLAGRGAAVAAVGQQGLLEIQQSPPATGRRAWPDGGGTTRALALQVTISEHGVE